MNIQEIEAEREDVLREIETINARLSTMGADGNVSPDSVTEHMQMFSRLQLLQTRLKTLDAATPQAQAEAMQREADTIDRKITKARKAYETAKAETKSLLEPLFNYPLCLLSVDEVVDSAKPVNEAETKLRTLIGQWTEAMSRLTKHRIKYGLKAEPRRPAEKTESAEAV